MSASLPNPDRIGRALKSALHSHSPMRVPLREGGSALHAYKVAQHLAKRLDEEQQKLNACTTPEGMFYHYDTMQSLWGIADAIAAEYGYPDLRQAIDDLRRQAS
jgi:hypothetical protein